MEESLAPVFLIADLKEVDYDFDDEDSLDENATNPDNLGLPSTSTTIPTIQDDDNEHACDLIQKSRKKRKTPKPELWGKNLMKKKREEGDEYTTKKKILNENGNKTTEITKSGRTMGDSCSSEKCKIHKSCHLFSESDRMSMFTSFWKNMNWKEKKTLVLSLIDVSEPQNRRKDSDLSRENKLLYHLKLLNERHQVCRTMFLSTLGLKRGQVLNWLKVRNTPSVSSATTTSTAPVAMTTTTTITSTPVPLNTAPGHITTTSSALTTLPRENERKEFLINFFSRLPKTPSHYCRQNTTKIYLEPVVQNKEQLRGLYNDECKLNDVKPLSRPVFDRVFKEMNLSIFIPRKDLCDLCEGVKVGNINPKDHLYLDHMKKKLESRSQKEADKLLAKEGKCYVLTMDLEQVKLCPTLNASKSYFKTKLACHNYTIYNLGNGHTSCFCMTEVDADCVASTFASCLENYLKNNCLNPPLPTILYSDGCNYQNRNSILSSAILAFSMKNKVEVTQKILEKGHTWMEVDSIHSSIESKLKNRNIYTPAPFVDVSKECRPKNPYDVKILTFDFFTDFSDKSKMKYQSIRPGQKSGDSVVTDLRVLKYTQEGKILYKLNYSDEFQDVPNNSKSSQSLSFPKLYKSPLEITDRKYADLQDLKDVIPQEYHAFYDALPHGKPEKKKRSKNNDN